jgi:hypothetical protein
VKRVRMFLSLGNHIDGIMQSVFSMLHLLIFLFWAKNMCLASFIVDHVIVVLFRRGKTLVGGAEKER